MGTAAIIGGGIAIVGAIKQRKAGKEADALAQQDAAATERETAATIDRTRLQQKQALSATKARSGASGIRSGGSTSEFMAEMERVFEEDIKNIQESGASQASMERAQGRIAKSQSTAAAWGSVASGVSSMAGFWS